MKSRKSSTLLWHLCLLPLLLHCFFKIFYQFFLSLKLSGNILLEYKKVQTTTFPVKPFHHSCKRATALRYFSRLWPLKPISSCPCARSLLSEATQCDSGPEIGTPAWINPTRRPVIKQPGVFQYALMGGERERGKDKEAEWQRMAVIRWV